LSAGEPWAVGTYTEHQREVFGDIDPLAEGAREWPDELSAGEVLTVPESVPLRGWRYWAVSGRALVAPFMTAKSHLTRKHPGVEWRPGANASTARYGSGIHPLPDCGCGIRAMQSRTAIDLFTYHMTDTYGPPGAVAESTSGAASPGTPGRRLGLHAARQSCSDRRRDRPRRGTRGTSSRDRGPLPDRPRRCQPLDHLERLFDYVYS